MVRGCYEENGCRGIRIRCEGTFRLMSLTIRGCVVKAAFQDTETDTDILADSPDTRLHTSEDPLGVV